MLSQDPPTNTPAAAKTREFNLPSATITTTPTTIKAVEYKKCIEPSSTTPMGQKQSHKCDVCGKSFPSCQALGGHKTSHRSRPPPTTPPPPPPPKTSSSRMYLISNQEFNPPAAAIITTPTTIKAIEYKKGIEPSSTTPLGQKQSHKCDMCGKSFPSWQALSGHRTSHRSRPQPTTPPPPPPPKTPSSRMYLISNQVVAAAL
ncbi:zinc finger protein AZF1-like [Olea europaea var. sylvestris]|uniref:Zinc finger AZF2-like n=1 Tax=Olea europaea subsp. europaea TaxID=158383 RepID=A0A8S0Q5R1_OLEEU|nr:zinc finger protein AZF1-like [Olea europaea var. sylvestris]CAA2962158.1 zinc finger AZF2-like [Olea europaea subsp. europaea]